MFYFNEGELVDAQLDNLSGLQAVCVALAQPPGCFNFNPLIQPSRRSIENSLQKVVSELLGCWDEHGPEIETIASGATLAQPVPIALPPSTFNDPPERRTDQALVFSSVPLEAPASGYSRPILAMAAAGLMMLGLSTVIAVTGGFGRRSSSTRLSPPLPASSEIRSARQSNGAQSSVLPRTELRNEAKVHGDVAKEKDSVVSGALAPSNSRQRRISLLQKDERESPNESGVGTLAAKNVTPGEDEKKSNDVTADIQAVKVILQFENGRVAQASIGNHRSGMDAYEALALRIARQRRYPSQTAGQETVVIKVNQSN
jgi:hypothetical protein